MKTTIGGDRLGSGNKQNVSIRNYERSTHDLSYLWRSSMASGTLVPFMSEVGLTGDTFDIDLACEVLTLPTIGPLYGSYKVQLDVFQVPIRLYNAALHMNKLGIGMEMSNVYLPTITPFALKQKNGYEYANEAPQINPSSLLSYLGIRGIGHLNSSALEDAYVAQYYRPFNAVSFLMYWDIYKNYYANKQEEVGYYIHTDMQTIKNAQSVIDARMWVNGEEKDYRLMENAAAASGNTTYKLVYYFDEEAEEPITSNVLLLVDDVVTEAALYFGTSGIWHEETKSLHYEKTFDPAGASWEVPPQYHWPKELRNTDFAPDLEQFDLSNIDDMRLKILQADIEEPFEILTAGIDEPYKAHGKTITVNGEESGRMLYTSAQFAQEQLAVKTYQSDLFNNWISTEWIDGTNGINEVTAVDTSGDSFTIDSLNLAKKVYVMLNRIAISGGTYDDWLDAVYTHERTKSVESPMYMGSLIKELAFESVISNADTEINGNVQPLGTLAGRGKLTNKNKGGHIKVKVDEPSYIMGIVSLTPRVDYSQGNKWDTSLATMNDFHKPALDAIGYQDLITEQMAYQETQVDMLGTGEAVLTKRSAGKQPAWINYMTNVNQTYGNFAIESKEMFMTLNRKYDINEDTGRIEDLTTYIDPAKFNNIFADTRRDAQNFWVQISNKITARRKMSAKVIPNL